MERDFHNIEGIYTAECFDSDGNLKWSDVFHNTVVIEGKDLALNTILNGSAYTVTGPYMGLISSSSYSQILSTDSFASHPGWLEAGSDNAPTYSGGRKTCVWSSASAGSITLTSALSYSITGTGTVKGCFIVYGSGASATVDTTTGTLFSAGLFASGDKSVGSGDTINVSYTASI